MYRSESRQPGGDGKGHLTNTRKTDSHISGNPPRFFRVLEFSYDYGYFGHITNADTQTRYLPCTYGRAEFTNTGKMASHPYQEILLDFSASDVNEVIFISVTVVYCFISNAAFIHTQKKK